MRLLGAARIRLGYKACWKELPLALANDLSVFCYQEVGGDEVLSFLNDNGQLVLYARPGTFPAGTAWDGSDPIHCGVSGMAFFGAATSMAHNIWRQPSCLQMQRFWPQEAPSSKRQRGHTER